MTSSLPPDRAQFEAGLPLAEAGSRAAGLEVSIARFEGPLDLLLHLVRANDMEILDIPIVEIARQYNAYLDKVRELDLEIASEYLLMAATLAHIKSRMLLPPDPDEDGDEEDPRAELTRQLLEYERFKRGAEELAALESRQDLVFSRPGPPPAELAGSFTIQADLGDLVRAFERILRRLEAQDQSYVVHREDIRVQDMMDRIVEELGSRGVVTFSQILETCRSRLQRVVLFLALLELIRLRQVVAHQSSWREPIQLQPGEAEVVLEAEA
jgi:segregation and condensation protein A